MKLLIIENEIPHLNFSYIYSAMQSESVYIL